MRWLLGVKNRLEELKREMEAGNMEAALAIADKIPDSGLKTYAELMLVAKAYKKGGDAGQAKQLYKKAKEKRTSKVVLLDLMDCCLATKEYEEAEGYFNEFHKVAPDDMATLYIYRYKIEKGKKRDAALLVTILEELKNIEYSEEYAYELAKQYHKAGMAGQCMQECEEIILWFAQGAIVERARALLAYYRGEISLEEIKSVGERYVAEQRALKEKEERESEETSANKEPENFESAKSVEEAGAFESAVSGEEPGAFESAVSDKKIENFGNKRSGRESEHYESARSGKEPENCESAKSGEEPEDDSEPLPEIDLSCIEFFPQEEEENVRESYELFVPDDSHAEKLSAAKHRKLEEIFAKKQISLLGLCKNFARIHAVHKQLLKSLDLMLTERGRLSLVVTGEEKTGKTTLAIHMINVMYCMGLICTDRTAVTDADKLNSLSLSECMKEIADCNLVIERAGSLEDAVLRELIKALDKTKGNTCLILEDNSKRINQVLRGREEWNQRFNNRIHLPKYTAEDLLGFAYDCIADADYAIDKPAAEELKRQIGEMIIKGTEESRLVLAVRMAEQALSRAEHRNEEVILKMAAAGQIKPGNYLVLLKEDFRP